MKWRLGGLSTGLFLVALAVWLLWPRSPAPPVLVIGIDGIDWKIVDRLIDEGRLPHLARLKAEGAYGPILTLADIPLSPVIWTSVVTGKGPAKHNISWFLVDEPGGGRVPVRSYNRKARALWNILAENDRTVGVVGWWATSPAERVGNGVIVSDALGYHGFGSSGIGLEDHLKTYPSELYDKLNVMVPPLQEIDYSLGQRFFHMDAKEYSQRMYMPSRGAKGPNPTRPIHLFQEYTATMIGYTDMARHLLRQRSFDAFLVYFEAPDSMSHLFMKYAPPRLPWIEESDFERFKDTVDSYYIYADEKVGELLKEIDDDWLVVVLSDHGFRTGDNRPRSTDVVDIRGAHLDHEPEGVFIARGPHVRPGPVLQGASVLDVTPTLLRYLKLPVATDMDGRVLKELFEPAFLEAHPVEYVATYEKPGGIAHTAPDPSTPSPDAGSDGADPAAQAALERLRTLGYVGGTGPDGNPTEQLSSPEQHLNLGRVHARDGNLPAALREFDKALALDAENVEALTEVGLVQLAMGQGPRALQAFNDALTVDPNNAVVLQHIADLKLKTGDLVGAEALYRNAIQSNDRLPQPYIGLGDVLNRQGRFEDAAKVLAHAAELDPRSFVAHYNLGIVYLNLGQVDLAEEHSLKALAIDEKNSLVLNTLGHIAKEGRGDAPAARHYFEQAIAADPRHMQSRFNLGMLHLNAGEFADAVRWLEEAVAIDGQDERVHYYLGQALLGMGRRDDARKRFSLLVRWHSRSVRGWVMLARIAAADGNEDQVRRYLTQAVSIGGGPAREEVVRDPAFEKYDPGSWLPPGQARRP